MAFDLKILGFLRGTNLAGLLYMISMGNSKVYTAAKGLPGFYAKLFPKGLYFHRINKW